MTGEMFLYLYYSPTGLRQLKIISKGPSFLSLKEIKFTDARVV